MRPLMTEDHKKNSYNPSMGNCAHSKDQPYLIQTTMKTLFLILLILSFNTQADLNFSRDGEILEPGIYWAIQARYDLDNLKEGKDSQKKFMHNLLLSSTYGFKGSMLTISAIYQNGEYGFEIDIPRAFAWSVLANGKENNTYNPQFDYLKSIMTEDQQATAETLLTELTPVYNSERALHKFEGWYRDVTKVTGTNLSGDSSALNLTMNTSDGRIRQGSQVFKDLKKIYSDRLIQNQQITQHPIQLKDEDDSGEDKEIEEN